MKGILSIILSLACVFSNCQRTRPHTTLTQTIRLNIPDDPVSFDPRQVRNMKDLTIARQLFEGLTRLDSNGSPVAATADVIQISEDGLTYTFFLKKSCWTDSKPVTAYDFERSWKEAITPSSAVDYAYLFYPILGVEHVLHANGSIEEVGIKAVDPYTLEVRLERPCPFFLELLAFPTYFPFKKGCWNGPFLLEEWMPQSKLRLVKNAMYWDHENVKLEEIIFSIINDNHTESYLYEHGELDWLGQPLSSSIPTELVSKYRNENALLNYPVDGTFWFVFNTQSSPLDDPNLRKAFAHALERKKVISHILQGNQQIATSIVPKAMGLSDAPFIIDGDKQMARHMFEGFLQKKGWSTHSFPCLVLSYAATDRNKKIAQFVQQEWQETFGIKIELKGQESQVHRQDLRLGNFHIAAGDWIADYHDPLSFLEIFKEPLDQQTGRGINSSGWFSQKYAKLIEAARNENDLKKRKDLLREAEDILMDAMPICPLYHYDFEYVKKSYVHNVILSPLGGADFKEAYIQ